MIRFQIEFGKRSRVIAAPTPQAAWKIFTGGATDVDAELIRFREIPWNAQYFWDKAEGRKKKGSWYYVKPKWMSEPAADPPEDNYGAPDGRH